ncbi:MAG: hypothetical protein HY556_01395 [Euryarchaeota archaeon]|nr:hypothetical protein [Euryarchaeota archaeon]
MRDTLVLVRVGVRSFAKMYALILGFVGLLEGALFAAIALAIPTPGGGPGFAGFGIASLIIFPILFGILGYVMGAFGALIYNFAATKVGGLVMQFDSAARPTPSEPVHAPQT